MSETILELKDVTKVYPGVVALNSVSIHVRRGEVHALVGENGAGKSTLIKTVSGAIEPTDGTIIVDGKEFRSMTPSLSKENGIGVIYQELNLVEELSVVDNIFLGEYILNGIVLDRGKMQKKARDLFEKLNIKIDPNALICDLSVGYKQMVVIAKAVSQNTKILIMDEPSAALTTSESEAMFQLIATLKKSGVTIVYISHRLEELFQIADRATVLRDGNYIDTVDIDKTNKAELVKLMIGRDLDETYPERSEPQTEEVILDIRHLCGNGLRDVSLQVKKGEVLGLGGLIGSGRTELAEILFGAAKKDSGQIIFKGQESHVKCPTDAIDQKIALIPEDRKLHGALLHLPIDENITMPILKRISRFSVINRGLEKQTVDKYISALRIKTPSVTQLVKNLSGGNQQKVVLAKWLSTDPDLIIFDEPTRGIDVGAKHEIYQIINDLVAEGKTLIMISSEMPELIGMADRIVVLSEGRVTGELKREEFDQEKILKFASTIDDSENNDVAENKERLQ
ncbi:ribose ABC transporter ATP-binding protein [Clostridia bacterium]|nr:ribose ABC transporter ATP-binding protein [Clostridia bacterium]